jgi:hypothetical protein
LTWGGVTLTFDLELGQTTVAHEVSSGHDLSAGVGPDAAKQLDASRGTAP